MSEKATLKKEPKTKPSTSMTVELRYITPTMAKDLLKRNIENRALRKDAVLELSQMMAAGLWKENGESIIIDKNGVFKDGQHRLHACIKAGYSFWAIIVKGVAPDVMSTIDTGKQRGLNDVIHLNGYTNSTQHAATVKAIIKYNHLRDTGKQSTKGINNTIGYEYFVANHQRLHENNLKVGMAIRKAPRTMSNTFLNLVLHIIAKGGRTTDKHLRFIKHLSGKVVKENCGASWVYNTCRKAKEQKIRLHDVYKIGVTIKAYNIFETPMDNVKSIHFSVDKHQLPEVEP